ncbi:ASYMMETRIC LEAVES 2-LIKE 16, lateral organ boundaries-domain 29 [Hibiscus trionum]|uniref:ASYMMETRIC LEAVES 2-LIKE 16, lateral organ boundaries-domain 29 n=1 Tax=Hibiscus trionum TaxID=183268 RepID=A0A9W7IR74_HIBTR|nr:ASYMMETRIC LEAVES 2-LIKE 16, lateral organ boundaries-domain 29 [Hibiscus trionum]
MTGSGSPCGACKFLRRKCFRGCVFAPYFCHEQGATHFAAIHKVFGASNVSKLLAHLPVNDRFEAALTISYEAQARVHDPIYGCVSHIFALQQQVVNLQAQLASLKELQAAQSGLNGSVTANPNDRYLGKHHNLQDVQSWFHPDSSSMAPDFNPNSYGFMNPTSYSGSSSGSENYVSFTTAFEEAPRSMSSFDMQTNDRQWSHCQDVVDELQAIAFGYAQHS